MDIGSHATFIIAAYAAAVIVIGALIVWIMIDYATLKKALADLEERGITRRSEQETKLRS